MQNQIPNGWQKVKLSVITSAIFSGGTPDTRKEEYWSGSIKWLSSGETRNRFIYDTDKKISQAGIHNSSTRFAKVGDVVVASAGQGNTRGQTSMLKTDTYINQSVISIRADKNKLDSNFLFYNLSNRYYELRSVSDDTSIRGSLTTKIFKDLSIILPIKIVEQKSISSILCSFDNKIEINNKIAKNLEVTAQTIFKEWFVKNKNASEWQVVKIKDLAKIKKGISYSSSEISEKRDGLPMINLANFQRGGGLNPKGVKYFTGKYKTENLVNPGDIVIALTDLTSNREVIGHPARVPSYSDWSNILFSLDTCAVQTENIYVEFLYYLMLQKSFSYLMASSAGGTNVAHLSPSFIENYEFVLPDNDSLRRFKYIVEPIFKKTNEIEAENQKLAQMRDSLLPKLIKGEIRV